MSDAQGQTRGVEPTAVVRDEAACICHRLEPGEEWPTERERKRKLSDLQQRYRWFGVELAARHDKGEIKSEAVRFFVVEVPPLLQDEDGALRLGYYGRAQAYSYVGDPPQRTIAGQMDVALQLIGREGNGPILDILCANLSALHARELARAT